MAKVDVIRAWKDELYRASLSKEERAQLPEHPAGIIELGDGEMNGIVGGATELIFTLGCCSGLTTDWEACAVVVGTIAIVTCVASALLECEFTIGACNTEPSQEPTQPAGEGG